MVIKKYMKVGKALNLTFRTAQSDTWLVSSLLSSHGLTEVSATNNDFNLLWTGSHPRPHTFSSLRSYQRVNHFPRSYELTRKDRLYKNVARLQHCHGSKHFDFLPPSFIMPNEYRQHGKAQNAGLSQILNCWLLNIGFQGFLVSSSQITWPMDSQTRSLVQGTWNLFSQQGKFSSFWLQLQGSNVFLVITQPDEVPMEESVLISKYIANPLLVDGHKVKGFQPFCVSSFSF